MSKDMVEKKVAALVHEVWAHWMRYMLSTGTENDDGSWTMTPELLERWTRQMNTPYDELSAKEQASDDEFAVKYLALMEPRPPQWISVKDALPNDQQLVLVYVPPTENSGGYRTLVYYAKWQYENLRTWKNVTHWSRVLAMPGGE